MTPEKKTQEEDREETVGADAGENPNEGNDLLAEAKEQDGAAEQRPERKRLMHWP